MASKKLGPIKTKLSEKVKLLKAGLLTKKARNILIAGFIVLLLLTAYGLGRKFLIAATVNGHPISRLSLIKELEKQQGQQALDNLITQDLISQEAKNKGISVTDAEVQEEVDKIKTMVEAQGTTLESALAFQGQTIDDLKETLYLKRKVEKLLGDDIAVSDDEISKYYDDNKSVFEGKKLDEVKAQIKDQLVQEKLTSKFQEWITDVRGKADIRYLLSF